MTLQLIVKGNPSEARVACEYNGITVISATGHPRFNETIIRADDNEELAAQKWFVASGAYDDRKPAPIGTLLWYGTVGNGQPKQPLKNWAPGHAGLWSHDCDQCEEDGRNGRRLYQG